ncbi:MAG: Bug family tripartite tricarboxylate transporter substrate binding protein [Burkholderiaceae bacterium]
MVNRRREVLKTLSIPALYGLAATSAQAQALETARVITGFPAGGTSDVTCRRVAEKLAPGYAKSVVVENRTGAAGQIAITLMKTVPNDGTVMLQTPMSMLGIYPHIYRKLPYDPRADVQPVSMLVSFDFGLGVGPAVPASVKTVPDYLAWCKANPSQASFGSPAAGSVPHFIGVLLGRSADVSLTHVPYRGSQPAIVDMMGGQVPAVSAPLGEFLQHLGSGKARLLGASGPTRSRFAPDVPTYVEQGLKDFAYREWFGMYLPAGASAQTVQRLNAALVNALKQPDTVEKIGLMGLEATSSSPAELAKALEDDTARWAPLVKAIGFTADS